MLQLTRSVPWDAIRHVSSRSYIIWSSWRSDIITFAVSLWHTLHCRNTIVATMDARIRIVDPDFRELLPFYVVSWSRLQNGLDHELHASDPVEVSSVILAAILPRPRRYARIDLPARYWKYADGSWDCWIAQCRKQHFCSMYSPAVRVRRVRIIRSVRSNPVRELSVSPMTG